MVPTGDHRPAGATSTCTVTGVNLSGTGSASNLSDPFLVS
ncbi:unannotated protein [freshwater metagenome]|jgi:hypothetical protein|uniref:Unannotated protein n=1 Tax=freshwater metagenome TaxID=449393 RepID=A0A6J6D3L3_9ZZZZ